jgi:glyoxylase-like metal-dependent hydrolase (beta-lactamase superfamily II)
MNPLEAQLHYPFGDTVPVPGDVLPVVSGIRWLRMPLPFALDHINLWLLDDGPGYTLVDCGAATEATRAAWEDVIAGHFGGKGLDRVLATHCHPDHVGMAHWLCARWNAPLAMTAAEFAFARMMAAALPGVDGTSALPHFQRHGLIDPVLLD